MKAIDPTIEKILPYEDNFEDDFRVRFLESDKNKTKVLTDYPTVYIHNWKPGENYEVYVGESNDIYRRTKEHMQHSLEEGTWQQDARKHNEILFVIGHDHFNKSLTLDIESKLIEYMTTVHGVNRVHNEKTNPQGDYYSHDELEDIFSAIWRKLRSLNKDLFPSENKIKESAIFKASPLKKLSEEQQLVQDQIIEKVIDSYINNCDHKLIFIDGEAGTGKTVLNSSTFYELFCLNKDKNSELYNYTKGNLKSCLIVNHDQQITVYDQITKKLGMADNGQVVYKPIQFINSINPSNPIDIAFVDEGHLLLTQNSQAYSGQYNSIQLEEIMKRAKITVVMFDENQILNSQEFWEFDTLEKYRTLAKNDNCLIRLTKQMRMQTDEQTKDWIDSFTYEGILKDIPKSSNYEIKVFDNPTDLELAIEAKASAKETSLSRLVATYDWDYNSQKEKGPNASWEVQIGQWHMPWNYELQRKMPSKEKKQIKTLAWAEQNQTIKEVGSTFSIQGFDLNYVGVILGPSVTFRNGHIVFDTSKTKNSKVTQRKLSDGKMADFKEELLKHEIRVLMTRGVQGLYIYACDDELRNALLKAQG